MSIRSAAPALAAALLLGASTPLAKIRTGSVSPLLLAGLLYLGSGLGLGGYLPLRRLARKADNLPPLQPPIPRHEIPWLLGAILAGGVAGPALLMTGLAVTNAASASRLLNVEGDPFRIPLDGELFPSGEGLYRHQREGVVLREQLQPQRRQPHR